MDLQERLSQTKAKLDSVSPSFCLAKWLQVTLHLQNGFNHSCHFPDLHKIPLEGLGEDPSSLHNTPFKKENRALMLKGERPKECEYCWRVEDTSGSHYSDRVLKSSDTWAAPHFEKIAALSAETNVNPTYVEVSFGNECNFRCSYCAPHVSSSIWSSYEKHGAYVGRVTLDQLREQGRAPLKTENNPYVKAFWDWFPSLVKDLKVFRITGGEPLVNPNTYEVLDYLDRNPQPNLELCLNSNLGVPERQFRKFLDKVSALTKSGKIRDFTLFTSSDTHGAHAEYLRVGLDYHQWLARLRTYLTELPWNLTVMVTFNALSVPRFPLFLKDMLALNREFLPAGGGGKKRALLDIAHLMYPEYLSAWVLNERWVREIARCAELMEAHSEISAGPHGFCEYEIHKMKRTATWADNARLHPPRNRELLRAQFYLFTAQFEQREGEKFLSVFPEMDDFYLACQEALAEREAAVARNCLPKADTPRAPET